MGKHRPIRGNLPIVPVNGPVYSWVPIEIDQESVNQFFSYTENKNGCLEWSNGCVAGEPTFYYKLNGSNRIASARRFAWTIANGDPEKKTIANTCRNKLCVKIEHLCEL